MSKLTDLASALGVEEERVREGDPRRETCGLYHVAGFGTYEVLDDGEADQRAHDIQLGLLRSFGIDSVKNRDDRAYILDNCMNSDWRQENEEMSEPSDKWFAEYGEDWCVMPDVLSDTESMVDLESAASYLLYKNGRESVLAVDGKEIVAGQYFAYKVNS